MPEETIIAAIERFEADIKQVGPLVEDVKRLKRWRVPIVLSILALIATACVFGYTLYRSDHDRVEGCRARNQAFGNVFDVIELAVQDEAGQRFVDGMRAAAVVDCDRDGETSDDITSGAGRAGG